MTHTAESRPRLVDWLVTPAFALAFALTLLVFDPLQRIARIFGRRPQEVVAGWLQVVLARAFGLAATRLAIERDPAVRPGTPYIIVANHQSLFDIAILGSELRRNFPKYIAKRELARGLPSISFNLRHGGNAVIDRADRESATEAIRALGEQVLERGVSAVIYPEGTRSRDGTLGRFKPAGFMALLETVPDVPIVPVAIDASWKLLRFNLLPIVFGTRVQLRIGAPMERHPGQDPAALLAEIHRWIGDTLEAWRSHEARGDA